MRCRRGAEHRLAVGVEGVVEVGRLVGLDPVDDGHLVGIGVDLAGGRGARRSCSSASRSQPSSRIASASRPSKARRPTIASWRSRPIAQSSVPSASVPSSQLAYSSTAILADSLARSRRRCSAAGRTSTPGGDELVEERRQLGGGLELDPLPAPDLRDGRPGLGLLEVGGDRLEPAGDRVESLGQRGVVAGEQQEQPVADGVEGERAALPEAQDVGVEDRRGGRCGARGRARSGPSADRPAGSIASIAARCVALRVELGEDGLAAAVAEQVVVGVEAERRARGPGCRGSSRTKRVLDEVVEPVVERARAPARAPGAGAARQDVDRSLRADLRRAVRAARDVRSVA